MTTEQWAHFAADGTIDRFTLTLLANGREEEHDVLNGQGYWAYNPGQNSVLAEPPTPFKNDPAPSGMVWPKTILTLPQNLAVIRNLLSTGTTHRAHLLRRDTAGASTMDVVQVVYPEAANGTPSNLPPGMPTTDTLTFSIDSSTYVVRRVDEQERDAQGRTTGRSTLQVRTYQVMPEAQAPAGIFSYTPPPGARVMHCDASTPPHCTG